MSDEGLSAQRVSRDLGGRPVVDGVSISPREGETVGLLGPNGSGKSTLLRLLAGLLRPSSGVVTLDGRALDEVERRALARRIAVVEQHSDTQVPLTVRDVVRLGRIPHRRSWQAPTAADAEAVRAAMRRTGLTDKADQRWQTLSGGERQRVQIARALAQQPRELLLDEPTNHLDIQHQLDLMSLLVELPVTTVVALHDLNHAAMFCDRVVLLQHGEVLASGTPAEVLTGPLIEQAYAVRTEITRTPEGHPHIRFKPTRTTPAPNGSLA